MNDPEAHQFAADILALLKSAGWALESEGVRTFMVVGAPRAYEVEIHIRGTFVPNENIVLREGDPLYYLSDLLRRVAGDNVTIIKSPQHAADYVSVQVHPRRSR